MEKQTPVSYTHLDVYKRQGENHHGALNTFVFQHLYLFFPLQGQDVFLRYI